MATGWPPDGHPMATRWRHPTATALATHRPQAKLSADGAGALGRLKVSELSIHNEVDEIEVRIEVDQGPAEGTPEQFALIALVGPLRLEAASRAEGRLTYQLWLDLLEFRAAFEQLGLDDEVGAEEAE